MIYIRDQHPDVYVAGPSLGFYPGETRLPHVYSTEEQRLCLYYRRAREWNAGMYIADTIIPWTSEWLLHYEFWLATGSWHGGGIQPIPESEKQSINQQIEVDKNEIGR